MKIFEVTDTSKEKLVALSQFLLGRADDTGAKKSISTKAFIEIAKDMGINITSDAQLKDLAEEPPLSSVIVNVTDDQIIFSGAGENTEVGDQMTVTQAQDTVEKMAKRALPNELQ